MSVAFQVLKILTKAAMSMQMTFEIIIVVPFLNEP